MMKTKFLQMAGYMVACAAFGLCLTACSDDDDNSSNNGGGGGDLPTADDLGITHRVTGIVDSDGNVSSFNYVDGQLTDGHTYVDNMDFTIGGSPLTIWCGTDAYSDYYEETYTDIQTNSYGAMTFAKVAWRDENNGSETFSGEGTLTAEYDGNRLTRLVMAETEVSDGETYYLEDAFEQTWDGNNVTRIEMMWKEDSSGENYSEGDVMTYEYGDNPETNSGIYPPYLIIDRDFVSYAGLFGRTTSHIVTSFHSQSDGMSSTIRVDKDSEGRITALYLDGELYETYLYDGQTPAALSAQTKALQNGQPRKARGLMRKIARRVIELRQGRR